jgi:hypothetical protein
VQILPLSEADRTLREIFLFSDVRLNQQPDTKKGRQHANANRPFRIEAKPASSARSEVPSQRLEKVMVFRVT